MATIPFIPSIRDQAHVISVPVTLMLKGERTITAVEFLNTGARVLAGLHP